MSVGDGTIVVALNEWCGYCMGAIMGDVSGEGMVERRNGVDVLAAPRPEFVVREASFLDFAQPFQERQDRKSVV